MPKKKRKREILIDTFLLRRKEEELIRDTTEVERFTVFEVSKRLGRILSGLMVVVGVSLSLLSAYVIVNTMQPPLPELKILLNLILGWIDLEALLAPKMRLLVIVALGFVGVTNALCGLILLAKE